MNYVKFVEIPTLILLNYRYFALPLNKVLVLITYSLNSYARNMAKIVIIIPLQ